MALKTKSVASSWGHNRLGGTREPAAHLHAGGGRNVQNSWGCVCMVRAPHCVSYPPTRAVTRKTGKKPFEFTGNDQSPHTLIPSVQLGGPLNCCWGATCVTHHTSHVTRLFLLTENASLWPTGLSNLHLRNPQLFNSPPDTVQFVKVPFTIVTQNRTHPKTTSFV